MTTLTKLARFLMEDVEVVQFRSDTVIHRVNRWFHDMPLALRKTDIIVLTKKRMHTIIPIRLGDLVIETKPTVKYHLLLTAIKRIFLASAQILALQTKSPDETLLWQAHGQRQLTTIQQASNALFFCQLFAVVRSGVLGSCPYQVVL